MTAASRAARCSKAALLNLEGGPATLVVERYDRIGNGWPRGAARVHQEDACQALGLPPHRKYASRRALGDDPTYKGIADLLVRYSVDPERELSELLRQLVVNLALGNWDAHAKNTSLLYEQLAVPAVAPMYDVVPVAEIEPRTTVLSMRVGESLDPAAITRGLLLAEAESWGLENERANSVIDECEANIERGLDTARKRYPTAAEHHDANARSRLQRLARL
ncbi:MAG: HipA domain-containing protein [Eggerthellaceae bacterium]|nr:HipA domain-containing protein [Eggerthellaceae bacterium]